MRTDSRVNSTTDLDQLNQWTHNKGNKASGTPNSSRWLQVASLWPEHPPWCFQHRQRGHAGKGCRIGACWPLLGTLKEGIKQQSGDPCNRKVALANIQKSLQPHLILGTQHVPSDLSKLCKPFPIFCETTHVVDHLKQYSNSVPNLVFVHSKNTHHSKYCLEPVSTVSILLGEGMAGGERDFVQNARWITPEVNLDFKSFSFLKLDTSKTWKFHQFVFLQISDASHESSPQLSLNAWFRL